MAKLIKGYSNIKVTLLDFTPNIGEKCWQFGKDAEFYKDNDNKRGFILDIIEGRTFPKFLYEGTKLMFRIEGISRICLAQLTREKGIFCSESHGTRPLNNELIVPLSIYNNKEWLDRYSKIIYDLEELYIDVANADIPFMDARYLMPHSQTISINYAPTLLGFVNSCNSRTRNNFGDEINYVYKLMRHELIRAIYNRYSNEIDTHDLTLWQFMLEKSYNRSPFTRDCTYCNGFNEFPLPKDFEFPETAHCDWRKSAWKLELERLYRINSPLLTDSERIMIANWHNGELDAYYDENSPKTMKSMIKQMDYYDEHRGDRND